MARPCHEPYQEIVAKQMGFGMTCVCGAVVSSAATPENGLSQQQFEEILSRMPKDPAKQQIILQNVTSPPWQSALHKIFQLPNPKSKERKAVEDDE